MLAAVRTAGTSCQAVSILLPKSCPAPARGLTALAAAGEGDGGDGVALRVARRVEARGEVVDLGQGRR